MCLSPPHRKNLSAQLDIDAHPVRTQHRYVLHGRKTMKCVSFRQSTDHISAINFGKRIQGDTPSGPTQTHSASLLCDVFLWSPCFPPHLLTASYHTVPFVLGRNLSSPFAYPAVIAMPSQPQRVARSLLILGANEVGRTNVRGGTESEKVVSARDGWGPKGSLVVNR